MKVKNFISKHGVKIISTATLLSLGYTVYATIKATRECSKLFDDLDDTASVTDKIRLAAPHCISPAVGILATTAGVLASSSMYDKTYNNLTTACSVAVMNLTNFKDATVKTYGPKALENIEYVMKNDANLQYDGHFTHHVTENSEKETFYDEFSDRYFEATMVDVLGAQYHLNRNYHLCLGRVTLNEFYTFMGIDGVHNGDTIGWEICNWEWIDMNLKKTTLDDGMICYILEFTTPPDVFEDD